MNRLMKEIKESDPNYLNCICPICGKKFHLKQSLVDKCKSNCCSRSCSAELKKINMSGAGNHQFGLKGRLNSSWKSDEKISHYGYRLIRDLDHPFANSDGFVFEHRLVAEKYLLNKYNSVEINGKTYLRNDYDVHHKDFNRLNNSVENLLVMTKAEHKSLHNKLSPRARDKTTGRFISI